MQRSVYHKYAEKEYEIDKKKYLEYLEENGKNENGEYYHDLQDYILDNEDIWVDDMDHEINKAKLVFGTGLYDIEGMEDAEADCEWRYETEKEGGHLYL